MQVEVKTVSIEEKINPIFSSLPLDEIPSTVEFKEAAIVEQLTNGKKHGIIMRLTDDENRNYVLHLPVKVLYALAGEAVGAERVFKDLKHSRKK